MKTKTQTPITKTQFEMYTEIWNEIDGLIEYRMNKFNQDMLKLQENFTHYLSWNAEDMFKYKYEADCLKSLKDGLKFDTETGFDYWIIQYIVENFADNVANGLFEVRANSTNEIKNACSTWEFEVQKEIYKKCKSFLRQIDKFMLK